MCRDWASGCISCWLYYVPGLGELLYSVLVVLCVETGCDCTVNRLCYCVGTG